MAACIPHAHIGDSPRVSTTSVLLSAGLAVSVCLNVVQMLDQRWPTWRPSLAEVTGSGDLAGGVLQGRALSQEGAVNGSATHGSDDGGHGETHPQNALFFFFMALLVGTILLQFSTLPRLHGLQHTVALFVLGVIYSVLQWALGLEEKLGLLWESYYMWMGIDPHLLLFTLLPVLLIGDSMTIDTSVARRVANICVYLAAPGVAISAGLTAGFIHLYLGWSALLSLTLGAILSATDPVAVVSLLKQLGAAPTLTVQIAGESLLNDGTAIVLYTICHDMLTGESYDTSGLIIFLGRTVGGAVGVGWLIGWAFVLWIQSAENRFEHHSSMIQIALTICCAYSSFLLAEGVLHMSGVLATVSAGLVLADNMWPSIVEQESMSHVWHMLEYLGNTIIFFLAGALTGRSMKDIQWADYFHLVVIYLVLMVIRGMVVFCSRPILKRLSADGQEVTKAECCIITWGGLRGAVGLALAIQVSVDRAGGALAEQDAKRVLFFTGGIAFLTLVINATTCPMLVKFLRLTQPDRTKQVMLLAMLKQLWARAFSGVHSEGSSRLMSDMLKDVKDLIETAELQDHGALKNMRVNAAPREGEAPVAGMEISERSGMDAVLPMPSSNFAPSESVEGAATSAAADWHSFEPSARSALGAPSSGRAGGSRTESRGSGFSRFSLLSRSGSRSFRDGIEVWQHYFAQKVTAPGQDSESIYRRFDETRRLYEESVASGEFIAALPSVSMPWGHDEEYMKGLLVGPGASAVSLDLYMLRATHHAFLNLVRASYWEQIEHGMFTQGIGGLAELLLNSVSFAFPKEKAEMADFTFILNELGICDEAMQAGKRRRGTKVGSGDGSCLVGGNSCTSPSTVQGRLRLCWCETQAKALRIVKSLLFNVFITGTIILNICFIFFDSAAMLEDVHHITVWLFLEIIFNAVFFFEFSVMFCTHGFAYFRSFSNLFDVFLLASGVLGIIVDVWGVGQQGIISSDAQVMKASRICRAMRVMRVLRLIKFLTILKAKLRREEVSAEVASDVKTISVMMAFARAHMSAQEHLVKYFGSEGRVSTREQAQCLIESQTNVYRAALLALRTASHVDGRVLASWNMLKDATHVVHDLNHYIEQAHAVGVLSAKDADALLKPIKDHSTEWAKYIKSFELGLSRSRTRLDDAKGKRVTDVLENFSSEGSIGFRVFAAALTRDDMAAADCAVRCSRSTVDFHTSDESTWLRCSAVEASPKLPGEIRENE